MRKKYERVKNIFLDKLNSEQPRMGLDQETTNGIKQWLMDNHSMSVSDTLLIEVLKDIVGSPQDGYQTRDGIFTWGDGQHTNGRILPKYWWFFH